MNFSKNQIFFSFFCAIFLALSPFCAFSRDFLFSNISLPDGLVNPSVKCILRDSKDYIWIGTKGGLNRYDRGLMKTYKRNPSLENSLPDNDIIDVFEDKNGQIWVICSTGVVKYNPYKDNFVPITTIDGNKLRARSYLLIPNGIVFGGAGNLFFYDYSTGKITRRDTHGGSDKYYTAIHPWTRDRYLLATRWDGMWLYNTKTGDIEQSNVITGDRIMASHIDSDGDLWVSEYGKGITHIDRSGKIQPVSVAGLDSEGIILDICDHKDYIIIATDGEGIISYDKSSGITRRIDEYEDSPRPLRSVNRLYKDRHGLIYAGSVRGGLYYIHPTPLKTISLTSENEDFTITTLLNDHQKVWVGIDGNGLIQYQPYDHDRITPVESSFGLKIVSIDNFDDKSLLVSTYDNGLLLFDKNTLKFSEAPNWMQKISEENKGKGLPIDVKRLPENRIALVSDKIYISDLQGTRVAVVEPKGPSTRLRLFYNDIGNLLCYNDNEVFNVDLDEENINPLFKIQDKIECAVYDGNRFIYTGTSSGVMQYDFETGEVTMAEPESRMPPGTSVTALAYNDDELWIGAMGQIFLRNTRDGGIRGFGPNDGVSPNEFIYKAVLSTPQYLLMGGVNGLLKINLKDLNDYDIAKTRVPLSLSEVIVDGLPVSMNGNQARLPDEYSTVKLRLAGGSTNPFDPNRIRIFVGNKSNSSAIETTDNSLTLGHIQATQGGKYNIYASMREVNGQWSAPTQIGAILVPVAWWRKPIAIIIICILAALALGFGIFFYFYRRKNNVMNKVEEKRRQSLEKEVGFLMNLNYELRTPLTLIYSRLKLLTDSVNKGEISEQKMLKELDNIYRNTGKMRDIINTTVDLWRSGDMKTGEILEKTEVSLLIKEILNELKGYIHDKKLLVKTDGVKENEEILCDLRRATIALLNVFRSVISHAREKSEVTLMTKGDDDQLRIEITFYNDQSHGAGEELRYADYLMALMDGELTYTRNEDGKPSIIVMEFPRELKRQSINAENMPGTEVDALSFHEANEDFVQRDELSGFNLSHLTVLIVEDDPELRELFMNSLSSLFSRVLEASNGKDALTIIKNSNPDLIITEARLPQMSGLELCRTIKKTKQYSHIPVIMLTTLLEEMSISNGNNFGADNYLTKPFDIGVLEKRCYSVLKSFDRVKQWYKSQVSDILPQDKRHTNDAETFILKVREIVEQNISKQGFGVEDIVNQLLVSRSTLYGKFKDLTGQSLGNYINELKLTKAKDMLANTDMTMVEISDALGFATQRYFSTFFKEKTGMTPTSYRNQLAG